MSNDVQKSHKSHTGCQEVSENLIKNPTESVKNRHNVALLINQKSDTNGRNWTNCEKKSDTTARNHTNYQIKSDTSYG